MTTELHPGIFQEKEKTLFNQHVPESDPSGKSHKQIKYISKDSYNELSAEALLEKFRELFTKKSVNEIQKDVSSLRKSFYEKLQEQRKIELETFLADGKEEVDFHYLNPLQSAFKEVYKQYIQKRKAQEKILKKEREENLKSRQKIIESLKKLYINPDPMGADEFFKTFSTLKKNWHQIGKIPIANLKETFESYHYHLKNVYCYLDLNKELREMDYKRNLGQRHTILSRLRELVNESKVVKAVNELRYLQRLWREEASPVEEDQEKETTKELKWLSEQILERKKAADQKGIHKQQENLLIKKQIIQNIQKLGEILPESHIQWQKLTEKINTLEKDFRSNGKVPQEEKEVIWNSFKEAVKKIYHKKNQFYKHLKQTQEENIKKKKKLIEQAKALKDSDQWKETSELLKKMQMQWKQIGPVSSKYSSRLWEDFQKACNEFFERYKTHSKAQHETREPKKYTGDKDEASKMLRKISDIQIQIAQLENNMQFFARANKENPWVKAAYEKIEQERTNLKIWKEKYKSLKNLNLEKSS